MNQAIFVGRIVAEPSLETTEAGATVSNITVAVPRPYKNEEGVYETDLLIVLYGIVWLKEQQSIVKKVM